MKCLALISFLFILNVFYLEINAIGKHILLSFKNEVKAYHFHSYYFQLNPKSRLEAEILRERVEKEITHNYLYGCIVSKMYSEPGGVHPLGNFITCCNATSMWRALPWFMHNHGNLSVLLHPMTKNALADHTERAMFLGNVVPLDITRDPLPTNMSYVLRCIPEDLPP